MSAPQVFAFDSHAVRVLDRSGEPWFVAADVCNAIGIKNPTQAVEKLDDDERAMFSIGRQGETNIVSESGLYTLILRSRDATTAGTPAHRFRKWVTAEVLPSLRKAGAYTAPGTVPRRDEPLSISHRADIFVGADRVFRATMRAGRSAGMTTGAAIRRAQAVTLDRTGIDMLAELDMASPDEACVAPVESAIARFHALLIAGDLDVPACAARAGTVYALYRHWCTTQRIQPEHMGRFMKLLGRIRLVDFRRKRYLVSSAVHGPHSIIFPRGYVLPPDLVSEAEWIGSQVECFRENVQDVICS